VTVYLGTSGWQYKDWRDRFYPGDVAQKRWLEFYAERFDTVESNNAFYRLPERRTFKDWKERTPDGFVWAVKASRFLTHMKRLNEPAEPVQRFLDRARGLGAKLGPVLLQLPPNFRADLDRLDAALERFPDRVRVAVEPRHDSWFTDECRDLLQRHGAALCLADRGSKPVTPLWRTAGWGYVRFHAGAASPQPCYGRSALRTWAERLADLYTQRTDVFVYFNNDPGGCALQDVRVFAREVERAGLRPTRVPDEVVKAG
jgi:uncharacterized protein YecE (DUF72 family)